MEEKDTKDLDREEYEKICYICRRPESKAGTMISIQGNLCMCHDCMQKTFDSVLNNGMDFSQFQNLPYLNMNLNHLMNQNLPKMEIPKKQQIKKKSDK